MTIAKKSTEELSESASEKLVLWFYVYCAASLHPERVSILLSGLEEGLSESSESHYRRYANLIQSVRHKILDDTDKRKKNGAKTGKYSSSVVSMEEALHGKKPRKVPTKR